MSFDILIVDDSPLMRTLIQSAMQMSGMPVGKCHMAGNGQEGLEILAKEKVDLALIDLNMPIMGGMEMIERIRQNPEWEKLPLAVISTEFSEVRKQKIKELGIPFIHKPFALQDIKQKLFPLVSFPG